MSFGCFTGCNKDLNIMNNPVCASFKKIIHIEFISHCFVSLKKFTKLHNSVSCCQRHQATWRYKTACSSTSANATYLREKIALWWQCTTHSVTTCHTLWDSLFNPAHTPSRITMVSYVVNEKNTFISKIVISGCGVVKIHFGILGSLCVVL